MGCAQPGWLDKPSTQQPSCTRAENPGTCVAREGGWATNALGNNCPKCYVYMAQLGQQYMATFMTAQLGHSARKKIKEMHVPSLVGPPRLDLY